MNNKKNNQQNGESEKRRDLNEDLQGESDINDVRRIRGIKYLFARGAIKWIMEVVNFKISYQFYSL